MKTKNASPYRWAVLAGFMLLNIAIQVQWLSHARWPGQSRYFTPGSLIPSPW